MSLRDRLTSDKQRARYDKNYNSFEETFTMKELEEHDEEIRADERRKFAEWLDKSYKYSLSKIVTCCVEDEDEDYYSYRYKIVSIDEILSDYENELR